MALDKDTYFQAAFSLLVFFLPSPHSCCILSRHLTSGRGSLLWGYCQCCALAQLLRLQREGHVKAAAGALHLDHSLLFLLHLFFARVTQTACCYLILHSKGWASLNIKQKWTLKKKACVSWRIGRELGRGILPSTFFCLLNSSFNWKLGYWEKCWTKVWGRKIFVRVDLYFIMLGKMYINFPWVLDHLQVSS